MAKPLNHPVGFRGKCCDACNCIERKEANNKYMRDKRTKDREWRAKQEREKSLGLRMVADLGADEREAPAKPRKLGKLAQSAWDEMRDMGDAIERHPGLTEMVLTLADMIDNGEQPQTGVQAMKEIKLILADMRPKETAKPVGLAGQSAQDKFFLAMAAEL